MSGSVAIRHVDLSQAEPAVPDDEMVLDVFWWKALPLGARMVCAEELPLGPGQLRELAVEFATEQLAANKDQNQKLALQLQAILPPRTSLNDACLAFKSLNDCVAALHVSHNLKIKFTCLKWSLTAVQSAGNAAACKAPENGKPVNLVKAIHLLKPDADAKAEAKTAERRAHEDIKDASS